MTPWPNDCTCISLTVTPDEEVEDGHPRCGVVNSIVALSPPYATAWLPKPRGGPYGPCVGAGTKATDANHIGKIDITAEVLLGQS